jgi:hypothetical protein
MIVCKNSFSFSVVAKNKIKKTYRIRSNTKKSLNFSPEAKIKLRSLLMNDRTQKIYTLTKKQN